MDHQNYDPVWYLDSRDASIRSQVVPKNVERDLLHDFLMLFFDRARIKRAHLKSNQKLELEFKIGQFVSKQADFKPYLSKFQHLSKFHATVITDFAEYYNYRPSFLLHPWNNIPYGGSAFPMSLSNLLDYFRKLCKKRHRQPEYQHIREFYVGAEADIQRLKGVLRLDLLMVDNARASVYYDGRKEILSKERLENVDIMKDNVQFRVTANIENDQSTENFDELLQRKQFKSIRFKSMLCFRYQFLDVSISRVYQFKHPDEFQQCLKKHVCGGVVDWKPLLLELLLGKLTEVEPNGGESRQTEIELEVGDQEYFFENQVHAYRRAMRNVESFFSIDDLKNDLLFYQLRKRHPTFRRHELEFPVIGQYLQKSYNIASKLNSH